ncbi:MAG: histidine--tRNA ligase [Planctomycetales bacterium]|nr:histidine--tRNA ligase [bacterium]UNM07281.1 MAG: histidine--tRNA ligase [Planctomycetales bacterium]
MSGERNQKVKARLLKGMQDSWPELARARREMLSEIEAVCRTFGFLPLDTPVMEAREALLGAEPSAEQLANIFHFENQDKEQVGLRYDLTVPLSRLFCQNFQDIPRPFRRYQTGSVFRWDKPEPGRFREFQQFDIDTVGSASLAADAEILAVVDAIFRRLQVRNYVIRFSNRKILNALGEYCGANVQQGRDIYRVIDKLDKFDRERIRLELGPGLKDESGALIPGLGLDVDQITKIDAFLDLPNSGDANESLSAARSLFTGNQLGNEGLDEIEELISMLDAFGMRGSNWIFDLHLARGLGYYTGPVFEVTLTDLPSYGSVFGGGRYDDLVERFLGEGQGVPAVGASVGVDRLLAALTELGRIDQRRATSEVLVTVMDKSRTADYIEITSELRNAGIPAEMFLGGGNLQKQLKYADRLGIPYAVIAGSDEFEKSELSIKDLELGRRIAEQVEDRDEWKEQKQQFTISRSELVATIRERLEASR